MLKKNPKNQIFFKESLYSIIFQNFIKIHQKFTERDMTKNPKKIFPYFGFLRRLRTLILEFLNNFIFKTFPPPASVLVYSKVKKTRMGADMLKI